MTAKQKGPRKTPGPTPGPLCRKCGTHRVADAMEGLCFTCFRYEFGQSPCVEAASATPPIPRILILDVRRRGWPGAGAGCSVPGPSAWPVPGDASAVLCDTPNAAPSEGGSRHSHANYPPIDVERAPLFAAAMRELSEKQ